MFQWCETLTFRPEISYLTSIFRFRWFNSKLEPTSTEKRKIDSGKRKSKNLKITSLSPNVFLRANKSKQDILRKKCREFHLLNPGPLYLNALFLGHEANWRFQNVILQWFIARVLNIKISGSSVLVQVNLSHFLSLKLGALNFTYFCFYWWKVFSFKFYKKPL